MMRRRCRASRRPSRSIAGEVGRWRAGVGVGEAADDRCRLSSDAGVAGVSTVAAPAVSAASAMTAVEAPATVIGSALPSSVTDDHDLVRALFRQREGRGDRR